MREIEKHGKRNVGVRKKIAALPWDEKNYIIWPASSSVAPANRTIADIMVQIYGTFTERHERFLTVFQS